MKPSKIKSIRAKKAVFLLPGFRALTWKGIVYCKKEKDIYDINLNDKIDSVLKCHETIHVRQAEGTKDSWFWFYFKYVVQWLCNLPLIIRGFKMTYKFIAFELEAVNNEDEYEYCNKGAVTQWKLFNKLNVSEKLIFAKEYKKSKMTFREFVKNVVYPYVYNKKDKFRMTHMCLCQPNQ